MEMRLVGWFFTGKNKMSFLREVDDEPDQHVAGQPLAKQLKPGHFTRTGI